MYALVEIQGRQYKAEDGATLRVERMRGNPGDTVEFATVLLTSDQGTVQVGRPYVAGAKVRAVVEAHERGKKITIVKFKRRKDYRRKQGHRQPYTLLRVQAIEAAGAS
jgi:large subunit ribosomal protein L21